MQAASAEAHWCTDNSMKQGMASISFPTPTLDCSSNWKQMIRPQSSGHSTVDAAELDGDEADLFVPDPYSHHLHFSTFEFS